MTTWDTFDTDALNGQYVTSHLTFSSGNLTAVSNYTPSGYNCPYAQTVEGKSAGKWMVAFTLNASASPSTEDLGLINSSGSRGGSLGGFQSLGYNANGQVYVNQSAVATLPTYGVGDTIVALVDLDDRTIAFSKNGGSASATIDISVVLPTGATIWRVYPAVNFLSNTTSWTINCGQSAFPISAPTGYSSGWSNTTNGTFFGSFATNGYGNGATGVNNNGLQASRYVSGVTGVTTSVTFVLPEVTSGLVDELKAEIWSDAGGYPGSLLADSSDFAGPSGAPTGPGEVTATITANVTAGTAYWVSIYAGAGAGEDNVYFPPGGVTTGQYQVSSGETWPAVPSSFPSGGTPQNFRVPLIVNIGSGRRRPMSVRFAA